MIPCRPARSGAARDLPRPRRSLRRAPRAGRGPSSKPPRIPASRPTRAYRACRDGARPALRGATARTARAEAPGTASDPRDRCVRDPSVDGTPRPRECKEVHAMKVFNFSAGPAVLPREVLERAAAEMLDWHGSGMSVMEMSHRGPEFISIAAKAEADLRALMAIPDDYAVLFLSGRRDRRERDRADEPARRAQDRRLRQHGRVVQEVDQGGEEVLPGQRRGIVRGREIQLRARARELEAHARGRVRARVHQRDDRRDRIPLDAGHRRRAARGRRVVAHPVAADRRHALRRDLRRRAEERRRRPGSRS